jgi:hypothetical protein
MRIAAAAAIALALGAPSAASAATVVNGDFETADLGGWQSQNNPTSTTDRWYPYSGTTGPGGFGATVQAPPQGTYGAVTDQGGPGAHFLYQDIALEPKQAHLLTLDVYYTTAAMMTAPQALDVSIVPNQQYRVDVIRPGANLTSIAPADVLVPVFSTTIGDPQTVAPTQVSANLTPFAGQTVRLRFGEVDNAGPLHAGADSIVIRSASSRFSFGKVKRNFDKGTAKLKVNLPGPGTLSLRGKGVVSQRPLGSRALASKTVGAAGQQTLTIRAKGAKKKRLNRTGKVKVKAKVFFSIAGGLTTKQTKKITLKKTR